jgi:hypothetical protein
MNKNNHSIFKAGKFGLLITVIAIGFIVGMLYSSSIQDPIIKQSYVKRIATRVTGDGDPGAGKSGFFYMMIYPHQALPNAAYAVNLSNATAYEFSDTGDNNACDKETPYLTTFDIVVKVGVNNTDGYNASTPAWDNSFVWVNITCADLVIGANTDMSEVQIGASGTTYRWMQYYVNNGGVGYQIDVGDHFNITSVKMGVMRPV